MLVKLLYQNVGNAEPSQLDILNDQSHLLVHRFWFDYHESTIEEFVEIYLCELVSEADNFELPCIDS